MTNLSGISLICVAGDGAGFTSPVCAPANVAVIPSTARPATPTITLHTDRFMMYPLPLLTGYKGGPTIPQVHYYHDDIDVSARSIACARRSSIPENHPP